LPNSLASRRWLNVKEISAGVILSAILIIAGELLGPSFRFDFFALVLSIIAAIYIGFALSDGRRRYIVLESANAVAYGVLALLGMWASPWYLVAGYIAHGGWDLVHHNRGIRTRIVRWYVPFCVVIDWLVGAYIAIRVLA
jgi:hypothetical protein